jgi:hypothetical protein
MMEDDRVDAAWTPSAKIEVDETRIVASGWRVDPRDLVPGKTVCLHGDPIIQGRFLRSLDPTEDGHIRFELSLMKSPEFHTPPQSTGPTTFTLSSLPDIPVELTPYRGKGNPPFFLLSEGWHYPKPTSLHWHAAPTNSPHWTHSPTNRA